MAEIFPTPASAAEALIRAGWELIAPGDACNSEHGVVSAIVPVSDEHSHRDAWTVALVTVGVHGGEYDLRGHVSGNKVEQWAATAGGYPLLHHLDADVQVLDPSDPRAQDQQHEGMPADPFGETPELAAHATDAHELMLVLKTYEAAGFTRAEAFKLVESIHQVELDHAAQHCLVEHQRQGGAQGE